LPITKEEKKGEIIKRQKKKNDGGRKEEKEKRWVYLGRLKGTLERNFELKKRRGGGSDEKFQRGNKFLTGKPEKGGANLGAK